MAFGVKVKLDVEVIGGSKLRSQIQKAVESATQGNPIKIKDVAVDVTEGKLRSQLQKAINTATQDGSIKLKNLSISLNKKNLSQLSKSLESALATKEITVKVGKFDVSTPLKQLEKDLKTMLSGLSVTGVKEVLGADGAAGASSEDVRKKAEAANAALRELKSTQASLDSIYKSTSTVGDQGKLDDYLSTYRELLKASESAKSLQGDAQAQEVARISAATAALKQQVAAELELEKAAQKAEAAEQKRGAAAESSAKKEYDLARQTINLRQTIEKWIGSNTTAYAKNKSEIDSIIASLQNEGQVTSTQLSEARMRWAQVTEAAVKSGDAGQTVFEKLVAGWKKFAGWSVVVKSLQVVTNKLKEMVSAVKEVDAAMTELRKVTDLTEAAYTRFVSTSAQMAKSVGATLSDTINATAD